MQLWYIIKICHKCFLTFCFTCTSQGFLAARVDIYTSQTVSGPTWPPLVLHHYFPSPFCYFQRACPLPILPSPTYFLYSTLTFCTLALGILKLQFLVCVRVRACLLSVLFMCLASVSQCPGQSKFSAFLTGDIVSNTSWEESSVFCSFFHFYTHLVTHWATVMPQYLTPPHPPCCLMWLIHGFSIFWILEVLQRVILICRRSCVCYSMTWLYRIGPWESRWSEFVFLGCPQSCKLTCARK